MVLPDNTIIVADHLFVCLRIKYGASVDNQWVMYAIGIQQTFLAVLVLLYNYGRLHENISSKVVAVVIKYLFTIKLHSCRISFKKSVHAENGRFLIFCAVFGKQKLILHMCIAHLPCNIIHILTSVFSALVGPSITYCYQLINIRDISFTIVFCLKRDWSRKKNR